MILGLNFRPPNCRLQMIVIVECSEKYVLPFARLEKRFCLSTCTNGTFTRQRFPQTISDIGVTIMMIGGNNKPAEGVTIKNLIIHGSFASGGKADRFHPGCP